MKIFVFVIIVVTLGCGVGRAQLDLARELAAEGDHIGAALEFRRLALAGIETDAGGLLWAAAHEYFRAGDFARAEKLVSAAESKNPNLRAPALLLRGELAGAEGDWEESAFYYEGLAEVGEEAEVQRFALKKAAAAKVRSGDWEAAASMLNRSPADEAEARVAMDMYREGRDKSPALGGALGLLPGFGYFYAGEWANGFRSLILNSIFIFGMVHTAQRDQWGAFGVITFFEFTWYSGSIYGGIDASHRYNRKRLDTCVNGITGGAGFELDYGVLPAVSLKFRF